MDMNIYQDKTKEKAADSILGEFSASTRGFGFVHPFPEYEKGFKKDIFISFADSMGAVHSDIVECVVTQRREDGKCDGKVIRIIERGTKTVIGTLCAIRDRNSSAEMYAVEPDNKKYNFLVYTDNYSAVGALPGDKVEAEITEYPDERHDALGKITRVFGDAESTEANYEAILREHGIKTVYDRAAAAEADALSKESISPEGRLDLRDEMIFTIDGEDAKDLDDAISL